ncbi:MAG: GNAT family N-acetyltransferase [Xanthomonadales bacterium]|nr:GNAT family N-acetyltransferase [Xanthomonadales bacterium]MBK7145933.1 GNAT family N-acetyltransferase [Xanthomonadales bacterium]
MQHPHPHADRDLARRLERTEGLACAAIVQSRARLQPQSKSCWHDFGGSCAMFDGAGSPMTQAFGFGLYDDPNGHELDAIEAFFRGHSTQTVLEISPLAGIHTIATLQQRHYRIVELSSALCRPSAGGVQAAPHMDAALRVRAIDPSETEVWAEVAAAGWGSESDEVGRFIRDLSRAIVPAERMVSFLAELDGRPVASASLFLGDGIALLAGASTIPSARNHGAQTALLAARLDYAARHHCPLAMMATEPGSASQRNAERQQFRIAYTRLKWQQQGPAAVRG